MGFDLYAELESLQACPTPCALPYGLASGFVDDCTMWFTKGERDPDPEAGKRKKNDARMCYQNGAAGGRLLLPPDLNLDSGLEELLAEPWQWLAIEIRFRLQSPWYSRDDRLFHVLDNPVRKDRVFGVPYMSAASWKGLLRWAYRMHTGLIGPAPIQEEQRRMARAYEMHLFGNEKAEKEDFVRGALAFYPTWFDKVGFEVINPHSRKRRAGTQPILYEVVPPDTEGVLCLLYAPLPGAAQRDGVETVKALQNLLDAAEQLLTVYGFSAKRTAGWGIAEVIKARATNGRECKEENAIRELKDELASLLSSEIE
jgi:CRISPR-associated protein Cmr2